MREVLTRIVRSACELVGAKYGALGVLDPSGRHLAEFIAEGITAKERAAMAHPPRGLGILGLLVEEPRPLRIPDLRRHPASRCAAPYRRALSIATPVAAASATRTDSSASVKEPPSIFSVR